ncbi:MAG: bifunctional folylpolyglutamate synthase/dihydrofolate synthase [Bacteroidales bacterium]|nr:bifunctional folylpolyglutamate synthase/dihydrofolate synthase [Bacteroidales bacterium]
MTYKETLDFLFSSLPMYQRQGKAAYKANLDNSIAFDEYLNFPHRSFRTIHVAGTNGKGSSSHMLASVFQAAGYKTGLYTSPHLSDFRERIKIDGRMIPEEDVIQFVENHQDFIKRINPSFFEMTVFMAFNYFEQQSVDVAIIEVGMGGRLDSTNVIHPELCLITNISLDHTQFLGSTIGQIAQEKAGIIKAKVPTVVTESNPEYNDVFEAKAKAKSSDVYFADKSWSIPFALKNAEGKQQFDVFYKDSKVYEAIQLDLLGIYQHKNILGVLEAIRILKDKFDIEEIHIREGLSDVVKATGLKGRWQILGYNPIVVCDTGHNEAGIALVLEQINQTAYKKLHMVWGMVNDKAVKKILSKLPKNASYYFVQAKIPRAMSAFVLKEEADKLGLEGTVIEDVKTALKEALKMAESNDLVFVGGSTFVVAEVV